MKPTLEQQVLFQLLKGDLQRLPDGFDAGLFFQLLLRHKLLPLGEKLLPLLDLHIKEKWKQALHGWVFRSEILFSELKEITRLLVTAHIQVISLKGPTLSHLLYGNAHGRFYSDLDLVVKPEAFEKAAKKLAESGYVLQRPVVELSEDQWTAYFANENDVGLVNREKRVYIELHRGIYVPGLLEKKAEHMFLDRISEYEIRGFRFHAPDPAAYFLYLCFHGAKHMYFRLCWLKDVALFLERDDLETREVLELAVGLKMEKPLAVSLQLAKKYFGSEIPAEFETMIVRVKGLILLQHLSDRIIMGPGRARMFVEIMDLRRRKSDNKGIDRARLSHWISRVLYLVLLRTSPQTRAGFIRQIFLKKRSMKI